MKIPKVARTLAVLLLPKPVPAIITLGNHIITSMSNNANFPNIDLGPVKTAMTALGVSESAALARTKGSVATRNENRAVLVSELELVKAAVQKIADANPENALSIIQSAGMSIRKTATRKKRVFEALPGPVSGSVKVVVPSAGQRVAYAWQYSTDGGKTWVDLPITVQAKTAVSNLQPLTTVSFRYRTAGKAGETDWSAAISIVVH
jgi:hypothetical protein